MPSRPPTVPSQKLKPMDFWDYLEPVDGVTSERITDFFNNFFAQKRLAEDILTRLPGVALNYLEYVVALCLVQICQRSIEALEPLLQSPPSGGMPSWFSESTLPSYRLALRNLRQLGYFDDADSDNHFKPAVLDLFQNCPAEKRNSLLRVLIELVCEMAGITPDHFAYYDLNDEVSRVLVCFDSYILPLNVESEAWKLVWTGLNPNNPQLTAAMADWGSKYLQYFVRT